MIASRTEKELYKQLCDENSDIPLFMQAWWMNTVCNDDNWDVILYQQNNQICAAWVFHFVVRAGYTLIIQPQLTQVNGIWINKPPNTTGNNLLNFEHKAIQYLLNKFSSIKFSYFNQLFHHSFTNWLPFYWNNFEQTTRYTYQLKDISNPEKCYNEFTYAKRKQIKKAEKSIKIDFELSGDEFYNHVDNNLRLNNQTVLYSRTTFLNLYQACIRRNQGCIIGAKDANNKLHAALFIVWDKNSAYNLLSTIHPAFRSSGASTLVVWEAIKLMSTKTKIFDFEGSMDKNIEKSFRGFGASQVPYFKIKKQNSLVISSIAKLRKWK